MDEFLSTMLKDELYTKKLKLAWTNKKYDTMAQVRIVNTKILLKAIEETLHKNEFEKILSERKRRN